MSSAGSGFSAPTVQPPRAMTRQRALSDRKRPPPDSPKVTLCNIHLSADAAGYRMAALYATPARPPPATRYFGTLCTGFRGVDRPRCTFAPAVARIRGTAGRGLALLPRPLFPQPSENPARLTQDALHNALPELGGRHRGVSGYPVHGKTAIARTPRPGRTLIDDHGRDRRRVRRQFLHFDPVAANLVRRDY